MKIASAHTPEMVEQELRDFIDAFPGDRCAPTLGQLIRLRLARSPFILGGTPTRKDIETACDILVYHPSREDGRPLVPPAAVATEIARSIATAFRALAIIQPAKSHHHGPVSKYPQWGPEWLADIIASVAAATPGACPHDILWGMSACQAFHLVAAAVRKNGGCTRRPEDQKAIKAALDRLG